MSQYKRLCKLTNQRVMKGDIIMVTENLRSGITMHSQEVLDLRELFVLLTYQCNGNCAFCIEKRVHDKGFLSDENFDKALNFAREKGLTTIFLHGGEPSVHPHVVEFAKKAKDAGFLVKMFTNGIAKNRIKQLDGIMDDITISYRGKSSLSYIQSEWKTHLTLQILVTETEFPTLESLQQLIAEAKKTGMFVRINTLNPVNQYAYDNQYVSYLEKVFLELPDDQILCASNKVMFRIDGIGIRMSNKSLNPGHIKYSMDPYGKINCKFERYFDEIVKNPEMEEKLKIAEEKLIRLRKR